MVRTLIRSDTEILEDVRRELQWDTRIQEKDVGVAVEVAVVTLTGTVGSYAERVAAEEAAHRVRGVHDVANDIAVRLVGARGHTETTTAARLPDTDIAVAVRHALSEDPLVATERIETTVSHGWVMLSGQVKSWQQQIEAAYDVRRIAGVSDVANNIVVRSDPINPEEVRTAILEALKRQTEVTAAQIGIVVDNDGTVTLTGSVQSTEEKHTVIEAALRVPGVWYVDDQLLIETKT